MIKLAKIFAYVKIFPVNMKHLMGRHLLVYTNAYCIMWTHRLSIGFKRVRICVKPSSHNQKIVSFNSQFCLSSATTNNSMQISNREATSLWIQFYAWCKLIHWRWYCLKFPEFVSCHSIYNTYSGNWTLGSCFPL